MVGARLELVWPNKEKFLLSPKDADGKPVWVERDHPAAHEVRLTEFTGSCGEVNNEDPFTDNLLFTGDSLDVLRILAETPEYRRRYRGKVKLIYIDPPFNTGQTFEHYDDWMEHSTWLSFMRDRLLLMKELLAPDGSIWVHLDDVENHHMRMLMDEIFGGQNFISTMVWQKTYATKNDSKVPSSDCDFILAYAKALPTWNMNRLPRSEKSNQMYKNPTNDVRGPWKPGDFKGAGDQVDRPNLYFPILRPHDGAEILPTNSRWRYSRETVAQLEEEDRIWWGASGLNDVPSLKRFLSDVEALVPSTLLLHSEVGHSQEGKREVMALFPDVRTFDTPKPERLIEHVVTIGSLPGDIVLDCFGGSGTTAAVAHKMGRGWVTAEILPETVAKFTRARLEKVVAGEDAGGITKAVGWAGGGGFRSVTVAPSMYEVTPLGLMLSYEANDEDFGGKFAEAMAGQLGFDWLPNADSMLCGTRGRMRLAVLDNSVGVEETRQILAELTENQRVTIVAKVVLPGVEELIAQESKGSRVLKAPRDVLITRGRSRRQQKEASTPAEAGK